MRGRGWRGPSCRKKSEDRRPEAEGSPKREVRSPKANWRAGQSASAPGVASSDALAAADAGHVPPSLPDLILIDGGKGQLGAACAELEKLGLGHIPTIGLAKEFEEIYRPGEKEPLRLSHDSGALKLLAAGAG